MGRLDSNKKYDRFDKGTVTHISRYATRHRHKGIKPWNATQALDPSRHLKPGPCFTQTIKAQELPSLAIVH